MTKARRRRERARRRARRTSPTTASPRYDWGKWPGFAGGSVIRIEDLPQVKRMRLLVRRVHYGGRKGWRACKRLGLPSSVALPAFRKTLKLEVVEGGFSISFEALPIHSIGFRIATVL